MRKALTLLVLVLTVGNTFAQSNYPRPTGHVNDFADIISQDVEQRLEAELREYRERTSIELAVVTVPSLEGITVEEYTARLARSWGVGDKEKDNGVVLLFAPAERKIRIEVGYGMEPDMPDGKAGGIIRESIIPHMKASTEAQNAADTRALTTEAARSGVAAILGALGNKPFEQRVEERRVAAEKAAAEERERDAKIAAFLKTAFVVLLIGAVIFVIGFTIYRIIKRRKRLQGLHRLNNQMLDDISGKITEAEREHPGAKEKVAALKQVSPKEVWKDLEKGVNETPAKLETARRSLNQLRDKHGDTHWKDADSFHDSVVELWRRADGYANVLEDVKRKIKEAEDARKKAPGLLDGVADSINSAESELGHDDVGKRAKKYLDDAKEKYRDARKLSKNSLVDWMAVLALATAAAGLIKNAKSQAKSDKNSAEEARRPKPKRSSSSSSSSDWSSSSWSSGSSSSYDSGGSSSSFSFGGGDFGGGGASGSY